MSTWPCVREAFKAKCTCSMNSGPTGSTGSCWQCSSRSRLWRYGLDDESGFVFVVAIVTRKCAKRLQRGEVVTVPVFEVRDVTYSYHEATALDGLTLAIMPGQRVALLGANGSGKSTLLSILDGLCFPQKGSVAFQGEPLTENRLGGEVEFAFRRRVALVFQN